MFLIDAGTSYIKMSENEKISTINISHAEKSLFKNVDLATGHNARFFNIPENKIVNELVALSEGAKKIINDKNFLLMDVGSRDIKLVKYSNGHFDHCDWNTNCGAMIGFTIELMTQYFDKKDSELPDTDKIFDVTCGLLGITKFFDSIGNRDNVEESLSALIAGFARFVWQFAGKPQKLYLSGGLTENKTFITHIKKFVPELFPLGRFVLLKGLEEILIKRSNDERTIDSTAGNQ